MISCWMTVFNARQGILGRRWSLPSSLSRLLAWACLGAGSCTGGANRTDPPVDTTPIVAVPAPSAHLAKGPPKEVMLHPIKLSDVAKASGVDFQLKLPDSSWIDIQQTTGQGAAFVDLDADGWVDILLVGPRPQFFRNLHNGRFLKTAIGLADLPEISYMGVAVGDYDRDGFPDVFLSAFHGGVLLHNEHGKRLREVNQAAGIDVHAGWTSAVTFADLDHDGWPDLLVGHYLDYDRKKHKICQARGVDIECGPLAYGAEKPQVFRNLGGGHFQDFTKPWGFDSSSGKNLGVLVADLNGDGQVEVIFANDQAPGDLFVRKGPGFENRGVTSGTAFNRLGVVRAGMGIDVADYDHDGRLDLAFTGFIYQGANLLHNIGPLQYKDAAGDRGIKVATFPYVGFGILFADVDNDGWPELIMANGHVDAKAKEAFDSELKQPLQIMYNQEGMFYDISKKLDEKTAHILGRGLAAADYDHDGRVDLLVVDGDGATLLLHNETEHPGHYLSIGLKEQPDPVGSPGRSLATGVGIGATITARIGGQSRVFALVAGGTYLSVSESRVHMGLGKETSVPEVVVGWPSGRHERFGPFSADQRIEVQEGTGQPATKGAP